MCGIAGFTNFTGTIREPDSLIRKMTTPLAPRGPDGEGFHVEPGIALGHRRLSIIDLKGGAQPMSAGKQHIVYNGEIYNYVELRAELQAHGFSFQTQSDTEVILHQYAKEGPDALQKFNGMFAFAIWDARTQSLFLARDRMGKKPLYYAFCGGEFVFASELKSLLLYPGLPRRINKLSVSKYLSMGYVPTPHTIFSDIHKLEPGAFIQVNATGFTRTFYWDIPLEDNPVSSRNLDECSEQLMELLQDSVQKRLRSDVPLGIFLSGGLDSSTILALAAQEQTSRIHSFSIGFEDRSYDESPYAREVAQLFGAEHHHEILSMQKACNLLPSVLSMMDEPFADASILPTHLLSHFTAQHVKVALGGDGGDELFAGYPSFQAHRIMDRLSILPTSWRDFLIRWARRLPVSHRYASTDFLLQQFFKGAGISAEIRFVLWMGFCSTEQCEQLLAPDVKQALLRENPFEDVVNYVRQSRLISDFQRISYLCMKLYLQDGILVKVDRASMANGLEVRAPFLDYQLVEFACGIQPQHKLNGLTTKYILKHAVRNLLPRHIIRRRKAGFMIPLATWLEKDLRPMLEDMCAEDRLKQDGLFNPSYVQRLIHEHVNHKRDHRKVLWAILCFQVWKQTYGAGLSAC